MPFVHRLRERVGNPGTYADQRRLLDTELGCDLISRAEANAADVASQSIRVFRDEPNGISAISFVNPRRARRADAVAVQEQHDLSNHPLLCPARDDTVRALGADSGYLAQAARLLLDDVEHGIAKGPHELLRIDRPDTADHAGAEIFLDPLNRRWRRSLEERGFELDTVGAVVDPACMADEGDEIALAAGFDTQNAEPVLGVVECDPVDQPSQDLGRGARPRRLRHPGMMEIKILGRYRDRAGTVSGGARDRG